VCAVLCVCVALTGCHKTLSRPKTLAVLKPDKAEDNDLKDLLKKIRDQEKATPPTVTKEERNIFIDRAKGAIDTRYQEYVSILETTRDISNFLAETESTALSTVSTLLGDPDTKSILSAASALVTSTESSSEKNFFQKQTMSAIVHQMDAQRLAVLTDIEKGEAKKIDEYSAEQAVVDLKAYFYAGTLERALSGIDTQAAGNLKDEKDKRKPTNAGPNPSASPQP